VPSGRGRSAQRPHGYHRADDREGSRWHPSRASARVVFVAPSGEKLTDPANKAAVEASLTRAKNGPQVIKVIDPYHAGTLTADKRIAFADVIYPAPKEDVDHAARDALAASARPANAAGLEVEFSGGVTEDSKSSEGGGGIRTHGGVAPHTLSSTAPDCSPPFADVRDQRG